MIRIRSSNISYCAPDFFISKKKKKKKVTLVNLFYISDIYILVTSS